MKKIVIIGSARSYVDNRQGLFRRGNFEIRTAGGGEEGLALMRQDPADLVITDLHNPDIAGDELRRRIGELSGGRTIPVIILCSDKERDIARCTACGAPEYIAGAVTAADLFTKTARLLGVAQRKSYRVLTKVSVDGRLGEFGDVPFFGTMKDISTSGMLLETGRHLSPGDRISCSFFLGDAGVTVKGQIMRNVEDLCGQQYGIQFHEVDPETERIIVGFIDRSRPRNGR